MQQGWMMTRQCGSLTVVLSVLHYVISLDENPSLRIRRQLEHIYEGRVLGVLTGTVMTLTVTTPTTRLASPPRANHMASNTVDSTTLTTLNITTPTTRLTSTQR